MKKIKGTFNYYFSHTNSGSHRTSNGFKYHYYDTRGVKGPFFDQIVPLSFQDLNKLRNFASEVNSKHYYCEDDYEWAESYIPDESSESNEDFGLCQFYHDKLKIYALVKSYYNKRGYQSSFDRAMDPIKVALENSLKVKDFCKANYIYDFSQRHRFYTGFDDEDMLSLSFEYGNIEFINRWDLWSLVNDITDRFRYSYAFKCLEFDRWGDVLRLKWNFEPYVKPENIGKELYDKIIDQIENHSQNYTCY